MNENDKTTAVTSFQGDDGFSADKTIARRRELEKLFDMFKIDVHYGKIPGCDKPSLYKPGAELMAQMMGVRPEYEVEEIELPGKHIEYRCTCYLIHIQSGIRVGEHKSTCGTDESKYAFRTEFVKDESDSEIYKSPPQEWWNTKDPELLGGRQYIVKKKNVKEKGKWIDKWVVLRVLPIENPSDNHHTCKSMSMKRAFVGAIRTLSACSDKFTDSVEDFDQAGFMGNGGEKPKGKSRFDESPPEEGEQDKKRPPSEKQIESIEKDGIELFGTPEDFYAFLQNLNKWIKTPKNIKTVSQYNWVRVQMNKFKEASSDQNHS